MRAFFMGSIRFDCLCQVVFSLLSLLCCLFFVVSVLPDLSISSRIVVSAQLFRSIASFYCFALLFRSMVSIADFNSRFYRASWLDFRLAGGWFAGWAFAGAVFLGAVFLGAVFAGACCPIPCQSVFGYPGLDVPFVVILCLVSNCPRISVLAAIV